MLTHNHLDHTGGLLTLRRELAKKNPKAVSRAHVATGVDRIVLIPYRYQLEQIERVAKEVLPRL